MSLNLKGGIIRMFKKISLSYFSSSGDQFFSSVSAKVLQSLNPDNLSGGPWNPSSPSLLLSDATIPATSAQTPVRSTPSKEYVTVVSTPRKEYITVTSTPSKEYVTVTSTPSKEYVTVTSTPSKEYVTVTSTPSREYVTVTSIPSKEYVTVTATPSTSTTTATITKTLGCLWDNFFQTETAVPGSISSKLCSNNTGKDTITKTVIITNEMTRPETITATVTSSQSVISTVTITTSARFPSLSLPTQTSTPAASAPDAIYILGIILKVIQSLQGDTPQFNPVIELIKSAIQQAIKQNDEKNMQAVFSFVIDLIQKNECLTSHFRTIM
ncbi:hypothetical protein BD408DRAFT_405078 [Parasitella parasitica]|nr:hypothetical protein BD408DRAFT_405078 [Parasitella parasitica]